MTDEIYQQEEERLRRSIEENCPNHSVLKKIFASTYEAVEAYWVVLREESR